METPQPHPRRRFYLTIIYGLWGLMGAAFALPAAVYLLLPPRLRRQEEWVEAGSVGRLEPNAPVELTFRRTRVDGWKISSERSTAWVVKTSHQEVIAFAPQCTHLGCAYHWDEQKNYFLCPCHTSTFGVDGKVLSGPAPRSLDRYESKIEQSKLLLGRIHEAGETTE
ncbi:MAG: ubiquinol-cytochrome c reductase iron-sulfur subunit [Bryobacteraceae bacterium]